MSEKVPVLTLACASAYRVFLFANACLRHMHIHEYTRRVLHLKDVKASKSRLFAQRVMYCMRMRDDGSAAKLYTCWRQARIDFASN